MVDSGKFGLAGSAMIFLFLILLGARWEDPVGHAGVDLFGPIVLVAELDEGRSTGSLQRWQV